jgi:hypothetical protein
MDRVPSEDTGKALNRMKDLPPTVTGIHWYSHYPDHYQPAPGRVPSKLAFVHSLLVLA